MLDSMESSSGSGVPRVPTAPSPFACPHCRAALARDAAACACGARVAQDGGVLDFIGAAQREARAATVEDFYRAHPFPGYQDSDDAGALIDRCRRAPFLAELDAAIPPDARLLDCGCGTGQLAAFLALAGPRRDVHGVDGCNVSLAEAQRFRARERIENLTLARGDLFALPFRERAFDVVVCRGVVHHTPDPERATREVARRVAP